MQVVYAVRSGFHLVVPQPGSRLKSGETAGPLPSSWVLLESKARGSVSATTHEVTALNSRLKDATNDCLILTEEVGSLPKFYSVVNSVNLGECVG